MHYLRPDEYSRVLAEAAGDPRDYSIFQVFLHTGIRVSELVALLLSDLDLEQKTVIIHGKGNRERVIPLEKKPFQALKLYLDHRPKNTDLRWVISTTSWVDCSILPPMKSLAYVMPLVEGRYVQRFATYCGPNNLLFDKFAAETP